jgi:hypothetical protein
MGLDTSHDCWHGAYSAFMRWRSELCRAAGQEGRKRHEGKRVLESGHPVKAV